MLKAKDILSGVHDPISTEPWGIAKEALPLLSWESGRFYSQATMENLKLKNKSLDPITRVKIERFYPVSKNTDVLLLVDPVKALLDRLISQLELLLYKKKNGNRQQKLQK